MAVAASADAFALRHVLAKFPREQKTVIEECLAWHGLRVLLQAHRLDDLLGNASAVLAATEAARREVHAILREHSTRGPRPTARTKAATAVAKRRTRSASPTTPRLPRSPVKGTLRGSRQPDIPRPDVLAKYPFVDGQGNVGEILACPPRTTPFHRLAKREIRRLAKAAFMEYRSSAHGIRLRDFKSALSALFGEATYSACGGMHLILALAQEALPHSLQLVLRDTSDLGDVSTAPSVATFGMGLTEDNIEVPGNTHPVKVPRNDAAVDQSEWTRLVAHVVRRLWQMEGRGLQLGGPLVDVDASDDVAAMTDESDAHSEGGDDDGRGGTHGYPSRQPGGTAPPRRQHERSASVDPQLSASRRRVHAPRAQDRDRSAAAASAALQQPRGSSAPPGQRRRGGGGGARAAGGSSAQLQRFGRTASGSPRARTRGEGAGGRQQQRSGGGGGATADAQSAQPRRRGRGQGEAEGGGKAGTRPAGMHQVTHPPHVRVHLQQQQQQQQQQYNQHKAPTTARPPQSLRLRAHVTALRSNLTAQRTAALGTAAEHRLNAFAAGRSSALKRGFGAAAVALDIADDFLGSSLMASLSAGRGGLEGGQRGGRRSERTSVQAAGSGSEQGGHSLRESRSIAESTDERWEGKGSEGKGSSVSARHATAAVFENSSDGGYGSSSRHDSGKEYGGDSWQGSDAGPGGGDGGGGNAGGAGSTGSGGGGGGRSEIRYSSRGSDGGGRSMLRESDAGGSVAAYSVPSDFGVGRGEGGGAQADARVNYSGWVGDYSGALKQRPSRRYGKAEAWSIPT